MFLISLYFSSQSQQKPTNILNEQLLRATIDRSTKNNYDYRNHLSENEHSGLRRDAKRTTAGGTTTGSYKPLNAAEFLAKSTAQIRYEYRKLPNPPAKDTHAAR